MRLHVRSGRHIRVVYSDGQVASLARMGVKADEIHFSGYLSKERYLQVITRYVGLKALSVPPWAYERLVNTWWWQRMAGWIKSFVKEAKYCRRFWTKENVAYVREMVLAGFPFESVAAQIFRVFNHKIRVVNLIRLAVKLGWLPGRKPPPNVGRRVRSY